MARGRKPTRLMRLLLVAVVACGLLVWIVLGSDSVAERVRSAVGEYAPEILKPPRDFRSEMEELKTNMKEFRDATAGAMSRARPAQSPHRVLDKGGVLLVGITRNLHLLSEYMHKRAANSRRSERTSSPPSCRQLDSPYD